jgi:hypothetical protein
MVGLGAAPGSGSDAEPPHPGGLKFIEMITNNQVTGFPTNLLVRRIWRLVSVANPVSSLKGCMHVAGRRGGSGVPVWTIAADGDKLDCAMPIPIDAKGLTPERLSQLRDALSSFLDTPLVTIEAYRLPANANPSGGRLLDASTPLATHLADLIRRSAASLPEAAAGGSASETLYRMVIPGKLAAQMGNGLVRSMPSAVASGGIHSALLSKLGIVGQATFTPVVAADAAIGVGAVGSAGVTAGAIGAITVAAPLVLLAIATAATVYAEDQRRKAIEHVTELLKQLHREDLNRERDALTGCTAAIEKATAVLLDEGVIGQSLGLDSAVHTIDTAIATATRRAAAWRQDLDGFSKEGVEIADLKKVFPGIYYADGEFRAHLRIAALALAMKRRAVVLQAVEHAQKSPEKTFPRFTDMMHREQVDLDQLEADLTTLLLAITHLRLRAPSRFTDTLMTRGEVNDLLEWPGRLREFAKQESSEVSVAAPNVEIGLIRQLDGRIRVLPMSAVAS